MARVASTMLLIDRVGPVDEADLGGFEKYLLRGPPMLPESSRTTTSTSMPICRFNANDTWCERRNGRHAA